MTDNTDDLWPGDWYEPMPDEIMWPRATEEDYLGLPVGIDGETGELIFADQLETDMGPYGALRSVLEDAYKRAAEGKGKERHGMDLDFEHQPILHIQRLLQNHGFALGQILKKVPEAARMPSEKAQEELLDVIVYAAAAILWLREQDLEVAARKDVEDKEIF